MEHPVNSEKLEVLIVGAGISGLMLGLLLEQIGFQYRIFERASEVKPLGSAMALNAHKLAFLDQLGLYEDVLKVAKPFGSVDFYGGDGKSLGQLVSKKNIERFGYEDLVFSRPDFYEILRRRISNEKIIFKKKILNTEEKDGKVIIYCADNTSYSGDILIGADGAYSGVRQSMYKHLDSEGLLPKEDLEDFSIGYTVTVGVAKADPKKYPILEEGRGKFSQVVFNGNSNCYVVTLSNNQIAWGLGTQLSREEIKTLESRGSGWSADSSESTTKPFRDFPNPIGGTMGEMFDATPTELMSKVYIEEKVFKTWYHGHTVLVGDACHKLHPAGGQGASNAIYDAIILSNCLYAMKDRSEKSIQTAFKDYYDLRFSHAEEAYNMSAFTSMFLNGQTFWERVLRKLFLNFTPTWIYNILSDNFTRYNPQVAWLPLVENRGSVKSHPQHFEKAKAASRS
ncbi:hypothetical protein BGZ76_006774 [Entomortierella beljakovae]|nr:hypothetical protein BGZ76_006774 [Entomortierella beljakovae]